MKKNKLTVFHSNELAEARFSLSLNEFRLILYMISLIKREDTEIPERTIHVHELADIVGADRKSAIREYDKITDRLMSRILRIPEIQENGEEILKKRNWTNKVDISENKVIFEFHKDVKPFILNIRKNYTGYDLGLILQFRSFHSIKIYQLLKRWEYKGYFEYSLTDFREIIGIELGTYSQFKDFNKFVIQKAKKEFDSKISGTGLFKSDLSFKMDTIRTGRKVTHLRFNIISQAYQPILPLDLEPEIEKIQDPIIEKLAHYGLSVKQSEGLLSQYKSTIEDSIKCFEIDLEKGKIKTNEAGYLVKLITQGAGAKSPHEKEQEAKAQAKKEAAQKKAQAEAKAEREKTEQQKARKDRLTAIYEGLGKDEQAQITKEFESLLSGIEKKVYEQKGKKGIDHNSTQYKFFNVIEKHYPENS